MPRDEAAFLADLAPVGFILFARNVESPEQIRRLTGDLRDAVGWAAPIFIDQEGGRVQRLRAPHWREWLPPLDHVARAGPGQAARAMYLRSFLIAREHRALGIDGNCAPSADIARAETHPFLRNRCYGETAGAVTGIARAVAEGLADAGVFPVLKHIPGHGRATLDSHHALPRVRAGREVLEAEDFAPFRALNDLAWGMSAHLVFAAVDADIPATLSPSVIRLIREEIGFDGVLMTDDLSMNALPGGIGQRAARARAAGCDVILHCNGAPAEMAAVAEAAGALDPAAAARLARALGSRRAPVDLDAAEVLAELGTIVGPDAVR
ncbi:MAG: glycoside hydrolase family 3 N-terminal domain-containing protein [Nioella sp.]